MNQPLCTFDAAQRMLRSPATPAEQSPPGRWVVLDMDPMSKPRMVNSDRWKKRPVVLRYRVFCDELRLRCKAQKFRPGDSLEIIFYFPCPKSWSKRKRQAHLLQPHQQKPDLDNCIKVLDAILPEDKTVHRIHAAKFWAETGSIHIRNI